MSDKVDDFMDDELLALKKQSYLSEIRKTNAEADRWEIEAIKSQKDLENWNASSDEHRIYPFFGTVDHQSVSAAMDIIGSWARRDAGKEDKKITVIFNSPGGSVVHGFALWDFLEDIKDQGYELTTVVRGMAASMGGILLQIGDNRQIGKNSHILLHEVSTVGIGTITDIEDTTKFTKRLQERILDILVERSTYSKAQIKTRWSRKDWWISSDEALKYGFADEIA